MAFAIDFQQENRETYREVIAHQIEFGNEFPDVVRGTESYNQTKQEHCKEWLSVRVHVIWFEAHVVILSTHF